MIGRSSSVATNAIDSVATADAGIRNRGKRMLMMIEPRRLTAEIALIVVASRSWKGTIAQARLSPTAPGEDPNRMMISSR